ncbi:hypothetical protein M569_17657 [Genlisea aurea]|uniref:Uncharacterized protein n=1 Tax=Genlisea aurea TaxID=192259 RepID=S8BRX1_9LAMI|nr:hypothetical protein M569_17657 [Genlisea aurea]
MAIFRRDSYFVPVQGRAALRHGGTEVEVEDFSSINILDSGHSKCKDDDWPSRLSLGITTPIRTVFRASYVGASFR